MGRARSQAFGHRLRDLRLQRRLSQRAVGDAVGVSASAVGQWEIGATSPGHDKAVALEDLFGCPDELAGLLGYASRAEPARSGTSDADRLRAVEFRLGRLEQKMDEILDRFRSR